MGEPGERASAARQLRAVLCIYLGFLTDESRTGKCRTQAMLTVSLQSGGGRLPGGPPALPPAPDLIRRPLLCHGGREAIKAASPWCTWEAGEAESKAGRLVCSARPSTIWPQSTNSLVPGGWISLQPLTRCKKRGGGCRISSRCQQPRTKEPPFLPPTRWRKQGALEEIPEHPCEQKTGPTYASLFFLSLFFSF